MSFNNQSYMTHYSFVGLSGTSTCWLSLKGPTTWISRSTAKVSCNISIAPTPNVQCRFSLCPHPRLCLLGVLKLSCVLSFLESSISLSACITLGISHCSQKSYDTVKPRYWMTVFCSLVPFQWNDAWKEKNQTSQGSGWFSSSSYNTAVA